MQLQLRGKTALVTGASAGIGRAIAKGLAAEGVKLCITARRRALLDELAQEVLAAGGSPPLVAIVDIAQPDAPQKLALEALQGLGRVDILINCAGRGSRQKTAAGHLPFDTSEEKWVEEMTLSFGSRRQLAHAVLPAMIANKWGRIINITGRSSEPDGVSAGLAAKAGLHTWAKGLSRQVGKYGITVNSIAPGKIMSEQIRRKYTEQERLEVAEREIPLCRFGEPEELASMAVFLASPIASYITGTIIPVDGGLRRHAF